MSPALDAAIAAAVELLRTLPRQREDAGAARASFEKFRSSHPGVRTDMVVDQPPGSPQVDYDILLGHPSGGSLVLGWRADEGVPWSVEYADHWASNFVVTVNDRPVTIQEALLYLRVEAHRSPDLMTDIVNQRLVAEAIEKDPPLVSPDELQESADAFRTVHGLFRADAMHRWLAETDLTEERFAALVRWIAQRRKLQDQVADERVEAHFDAHRAQFETVYYFRVDARDGALAQRLAADAVGRGLWATLHGDPARPDGENLAGVLESRYARELDARLAGASVGSLVGPVTDASGHWIAQVLDRRPPRLDSRTRAAVGSEIFREWLVERRSKAVVHWHWL